MYIQRCNDFFVFFFVAVEVCELINKKIICSVELWLCDTIFIGCTLCLTDTDTDTDIYDTHGRNRLWVLHSCTCTYHWILYVQRLSSAHIARNYSSAFRIFLYKYIIWTNSAAMTKTHIAFFQFVSKKYEFHVSYVVQMHLVLRPMHSVHIIRCCQATIFFFSRSFFHLFTNVMRSQCIF